MTGNMEPLAVSAAKAAELLGVSRPKVYELMGRDDFPSFKVGGRTLISVAGLRDWVDHQSRRQEVADRE
jgi:excisionase family DNA binding protein